MDALAILREQVQTTLAPTAARVAYSYLATGQFGLSDTWRSALLLTTDQQAGNTPRAPDDLAVVMLHGVPGSWSEATLLDTDTFDLRVWLTSVQTLAADHDVRPPTR